MATLALRTVVSKDRLVEEIQHNDEKLQTFEISLSDLNRNVEVLSDVAQEIKQVNNPKSLKKKLKQLAKDDIIPDNVIPEVAEDKVLDSTSPGYGYVDD